MVAAAVSQRVHHRIFSLERRQVLCVFVLLDSGGSDRRQREPCEWKEITQEKIFFSKK